MKRGFTLIEMLIVVALIATLMTIVFRLGAVSNRDSAMTRTVMRMAKLENCLSGYYAAYGNYPPVQLHNSRDIYQEVDGHGVQSSGRVNKGILSWSKIGETAEANAWNQVEGACRAQPMGAEFPFSSDAADEVRDLMETLQRNLQSGEFKNYPKPGTAQYEAVMAGFDSLGGETANLGRFGSKKDAVSWRELQLFKFGLMSYLLPRYQMMMGADDGLYEFMQWNANNNLPRNAMTGEEYNGWNDFNGNFQGTTRTSSQVAEIENVASEAVCARWLPNLAGICAGTCASITFYGVNIIDAECGTSNLLNPSEDPEASFPSIHFYSPHGEQARDQYILDSITVLDGWGREYYYYSPSPHQSYQLWSAGENGKTFPPWIARSRLSAQENKCVYLWTQDDIKGMNH